MRTTKRVIQQLVRQEISRATRGGRAAALAEAKDSQVVAALAAQIEHGAGHLAILLMNGTAALKRLRGSDKSGVIDYLLEMGEWSHLGGSDPDRADEADGSLEQAPPDI